jgi:hypothetical protein
VSRSWTWIIVGALALAPAVAAGQNDSTETGRRSYAFDAPGWLGMGVACSHCSFQRAGRRASGGRWTFSAPPSVFSVDADGPAEQAGLRAGDTLVAIDGTPLTSPAGGAAFGAIRPGQEVTIRYRREGREHDVRLRVAARPARSETYAMAERLRELSEERARELVRVQHQVQRTQAELERQRAYMDQVAQKLEQAQLLSRLSDSARLKATQQYMMQLDSAAASWRRAESAYSYLTPPPALPATPAAPATAAAPATPLPPRPLPMGPISPNDWRHAMGPLRYAGRVGDVLVEVRGPAEVSTSNVTDSVTVITSRDVSVLLELRPVRPPRPARPARPATPAGPATPARPPKD